MRRNKQLKFYYSFLSILFFFAACKSETAHIPAISKNIIEKRDSLNHFLDQRTNVNPSADSNLIAADLWHDAEAIASGSPGDSTSALTIFKTGIFLKSRKEFTKAIATLGLIVAYYPSSKYAAEALFQQAVTFDNDLRDKENAKRYYDKFLKLYPTHPYASQVKDLQQLSTKTDEEIIKSFQKKNK